MIRRGLFDPIRPWHPEWWDDPLSQVLMLLACLALVALLVVLIVAAVA